MCKPMTEKDLNFIQEVVESAMTPSRNPSIPPRQPVWEEDAILELLAEVHRLRAEAIEWHPWPGEDPPLYGGYQVTIVRPDGSRYVERYCWWWDKSKAWRIDDGGAAVAWAFLTEPYGGEL